MEFGRGLGFEEWRVCIGFAEEEKMRGLSEERSSLNGDESSMSVEGSAKKRIRKIKGLICLRN